LQVQKDLDLDKMANEKFYLVFSEEPNTKYFIDEPINYSEVDFILQQKENRLGRDESLNGGENRFRFTDYRNHYIDKLFYYYHKRGFEAEIVLGIVTVLDQVYESELHFVDGETDEITYIECRTIVKGSQQIIKTRRETKVDLFSSLDVDLNYIEPLQPVNMLLQAKPSFQTSSWKQYSPRSVGFSTYINITQVTNKYEIEDSYVPFIQSSTNTTFNIEDYIILKAQTNLKDVRVSLRNVDITGQNPNVNSYFMRITVAVGLTGQPKQYFYITTTPTGQNLSISGDFLNLALGDLTRDYNIYMYLENRGSGIFVFNEIKSIETEITALSTAYNSIVPTFRLIDVMRQVVKSISGQSVLSQRYDFAGEFYDNVFFNGNMMRFETDKPFYVSLADIEDFIWGEHKGDSEIQEDGTVFFGIEKDFYTNVECGFFDDTQFEDMVKNTNQKYALNEFKFKYGKYQSLKENTEPNSDSTIHGESIWTFFNKRAPNKLEISIDPVRDAILIDAQQRLATKVSKDTATQEDDTIFVLDVIETTEDYKFTETTKLYHTAINTQLSLRSDGEVNFLTLGIKPFTTFTIEATNVNAGTFLVDTVTTTEIILSGGTWNSVNDGEKLTKYTYEIRQETIPLTNRTDEGFTAISNLISPNRYSNLRYSIKRNILNYWNATLATVNMYWKENQLRSTYYKNNGKCSTTYNGLTVVENEPFVPNDQIVSAHKYDNITFANVDFDDYITLRERIKKDRGYIRTINQKNRVIKVYPEKVTYVNSEKKLVISGEEKFEKAFLTITNAGGVITVNDETKLIRLDYSIENNEVFLYDKERFRLYNGTWWDKVSVNGATAETIEQLISWLDLLT